MYLMELWEKLTDGLSADLLVALDRGGDLEPFLETCGESNGWTLSTAGGVTTFDFLLDNLAGEPLAPLKARFRETSVLGGVWPRGSALALSSKNWNWRLNNRGS